MLGSKSTGEDSIIAKYVLMNWGEKSTSNWLLSVCRCLCVTKKNIATCFNDVGFKVGRQVLMI